MQKNPLPRLDLDGTQIREKLLPHCRLSIGDIWRDPENKHVVGCGDATDREFVKNLLHDSTKPTLALHDPPYNLVMGEKQTVSDYTKWCRRWVDLSWDLLENDATFTVWLGADQKDHFQPLPQFMTMMAETEFAARSFVTMRNQRGYGTQKNWMHVRQELLWYTKGEPWFEVQYTDIPRLLKGYYKKIDGQVTENSERSHSNNIRPGNVWVDIQQVFYRMEENVSGCYAQKPLKAIDRIVQASSLPGDTVIDFFAHSGSTLLACEMTGRKCVTLDLDPIMAEITIRRLERYRTTGKTGWQASNPFEADLGSGEHKGTFKAAMF